jgi:hypothetical protein
MCVHWGNFEVQSRKVYNASESHFSDLAHPSKPLTSDPSVIQNWYKLPSKVWLWLLGPNLSKSVSIRVQMGVCSNLRLLRWHFQSNIEQVPQSFTLLISQPRVYIYLFISSLFNLMSPPLSLIAHLGYLTLCLFVPFLLLFSCFGAFLKKKFFPFVVFSASWYHCQV